MWSSSLTELPPNVQSAKLCLQCFYNFTFHANLLDVDANLFHLNIREKYPYLLGYTKLFFWLWNIIMCWYQFRLFHNRFTQPWQDNLFAARAVVGPEPDRDCVIIWYRNDALASKCVLYCWFFVRLVHRSPVDSHHERPVMWSFDVSLLSSREFYLTNNEVMLWDAMAFIWPHCTKNGRNVHSHQARTLYNILLFISPRESRMASVRLTIIHCACDKFNSICYWAVTIVPWMTTQSWLICTLKN